MSTEDTAEADLRAAFEAWVSGPPFDRDVGRFSEFSAWPGRYMDSAVDLAWQAWKAKQDVQATGALPEG